MDYEPEYDYYCPRCNQGQYAEVGMAFCRYCTREEIDEFNKQLRLQEESKPKKRAFRKSYFYDLDNHWDEEI